MIDLDVAVMLGVPIWAYLIILSCAYIFVVISINHKWGARKEMRSLNKKMKEIQKDMTNASKTNDKIALSRLQAEQMTLMSKLSKNMFRSMVPMLVILPLVGVLYSHVQITYGMVYYQLPFGVPFIHENVIYSITAFLIFLLFVMSFAANTIFYKVLDILKNDEIKYTGKKDEVII